MNVKRTFIFLLSLLPFLLSAEEAPLDRGRFISSLMEEEHQLKEVPFAEIVKAATGKNVLPLHLKEAADRELIEKIGRAGDEVLQRMNAPDSIAQKQKRINEVSSHFEDALKAALNEIPGFACDFPRTSRGKVQRSGYPDLRLVDKKSGRVIYLDPKLYATGSQASSLRTFYYEPKTDTGKIHEDAHHLIMGFEHTARNDDGSWKFLNWELVDLSGFKVRLKTEFQGSNRDLYRPELVVGRSRTK